MKSVLSIMNVHQNQHPEKKHSFIADLFGEKHSYVKIAPAKEQNTNKKNKK